MKEINRNMHEHDPREFVRALQQILVSDSKRIGFLAGAGTSMLKERLALNRIETITYSFKPQGIISWSDLSPKSIVPGTAEMTSTIVSNFTGKNSVAIETIKGELEKEGNPFHIENLLSKIAQKELVVGTEKLSGLNMKELHNLKTEIEKSITKMASVHLEENFKEWNLTHYKFARWIHDATRKNCVEIFTTNYDYLFEIAFEKSNIPYFDGFIGSFNPFFHSSSLEDDTLLKGWTKLWKIHGSLGWDYDKSERKIIRGDKSSDKIMIFPSILKYDNSKKQPYVSYIDRLHRFLGTDDTVLFICGYAMADQHINDTILNALSKSKTSHAIAFLYDDFSQDSDICRLAENERRLSIYGCRNAVIGGRFGKWKIKNRPAEEDEIQIGSYFDQDASEPLGDSGEEDQLEPSFEGKFKLVDFKNLVNFLEDLNYSNFVARKKK